MDQKQLNYFLAVAKYQNFTKAAEQFYISQPGLSHQIKMLEEDLGCKLFKRNTQTVKLTNEGEIFLSEAKIILETIEKARQRLALGSSQTTHISIAYLSSPTLNFLPDMIYQFRQANPGIQIKMDCANAAKIIEHALNKEDDIYFSLMEDLDAIPSLNTKKIFTDTLCLVARKDHPAVQRLDNDFEKIASEPFLMCENDMARQMNNQIFAFCASKGFRPRIVETVDVLENLLTLVEAGAGITILPYRIRLIQRNNIVYMPLDGENNTLNFGIGWTKEVTNPAVPLFLDMFLEYTQKHLELF